jgi:hypothetical protein
MLNTGTRKVTRKACKPGGIRRKTCRGYKGRRYECPLKLSGKDLEIFVGNVRQSGGWITINDESLYLNRGLHKSRSIWGLRTSKPTAHFNDETQTIRIGSTKIVIASCQKYEHVKKYLA